MRLINVKTLKLEEFHHNIPPYAILSHTWGDEEITFEMYQEYLKVTNRCLCHGTDSRNSNVETKAGFAKITGACRRAHANGLGYLWCDTNCIDKSSSAELTEAINSMYAWYRDSAVCYAYLAEANVLDSAGTVTEEFRKSRWFTRGWTLQELLAPKEVLFLNADWRLIGNRQRLATIICEVTRIHKGALENRDTISTYSVAQRMSWAANRQTSKQEDIAYCLLGIFRINMPLLYGEGSKAFMRLQEEIIKESDDHSILAWDFLGSQHYSPSGILATSPNDFSSCGSIVKPLNSIDYMPSLYTKTNLGMSLELPMIRTRIVGTVLVGLNCSLELEEYPSRTNVRNRWVHYPIWIWLTSLGHNVYTRSPIPVSHNFLTSHYPDAVACSNTKLFGITSAPRHEIWVPSIYSSAQSCGAISTGFHVTMSFGRIKQQTGFFDAAYQPGNFIVHQLPPRGTPALSHEIISAGHYITILSIAWDYQNQPKHSDHVILSNPNEDLFNKISANTWDILFLNQPGSSAGRNGYMRRIKYIHDQVQRLSGKPTVANGHGTAPFVQIEGTLRQDDQGRVKVVVHLTFQEETKVHYGP